MSQLPQTLGQPSARVVVTSANGLVVDSKEIGPSSFDQLMQQEPWFRALCPASLDEYRLLNDLKYNTTIAGVITVTSDQRGHVRISLVGTFQDMENTVDNGQMEEGDDRDDSLTKFVIQADFSLELLANISWMVSSISPVTTQSILTTSSLSIRHCWISPQLSLLLHLTLMN